jgi:methionyl-tRNA synthetase
MKNQYFTTPLYYVNDRPHLGSAYTTVIVDILNRYFKLFGSETKFLTGTDEHGQKIQQAAEARGLLPKAHCDEMVEAFKEAWADLEIEYDIFFRTTDEAHKISVQKALKTLWDKGEIYAKSYGGWYSVSEEIFYTEKELVNGKTPSGREVTYIEEKNYFFKMSAYQEKLIEHINKNPNYIRPESRKNEVLGFLRQPLEDLCISRPKSRLSWGIELPFDKNYVTYVWFDALLNYANGVGLNEPNKETEFKKWWVDADVTHFIGKDILMTHSIYWSTILLALKAPLPKCIFAHGWILNRDNEKMSKSKGSVMNAKDMAALVGVEPLRYYLAHDIPLGQDAPTSVELIVQRVNNDLANNIGNLFSRSTNLITKYFFSKAPGLSDLDADAESLKKLILALPEEFKSLILEFRLTEAIDKVLALLNETNRYLEVKAPWKTAKTDLKSAGHDLHLALEVLALTSFLLKPIMPQKMLVILKALGVSQLNFNDLHQLPLVKAGQNIEKPEPLFPRIQLEV